MKLTVELKDCLLTLSRDGELIPRVGCIRGITNKSVEVTLYADEVELVSNGVKLDLNDFIGSTD